MSDEYEVFVPEDAAREPELPLLMGDRPIYMAQQDRAALGGLPPSLANYVGMTTGAYWTSDRVVTVKVTWASGREMLRELLDAGVLELALPEESVTRIIHLRPVDAAGVCTPGVR